MTPEEIFEENVKHNMFENPFAFKKDIIKAMKQFGKQCFEASREEIHNLNFNDPAFGPSLKYSTFEKYLETLETK